MLAVGGVAVFRNCGGPVASIGVRSLYGRSRSPGPWVIRLAGTDAAVAVGGRSAPRVSSGGWVVARAIVCRTVGTISRTTGTVVAAVPGAVSVIGPATIYDRGAVPAAVPAAIAPAIPSTHRYTYGDADSECKYSRRRRWSDIDVAGVDVGNSVHDRRVVHGNINNLRTRGLNDDCLWRLLRDHDL